MREIYRKYFRPVVKFLFFGIYHKFISILERDLKINERNHIMNAIYHEVNKIKFNQLAANKIYFGIESTKNDLYKQFNIHNFELNELLQIIENKKADSFSVMNYISQLSKSDVSFNNKSVCIIGGNNDLYFSELKKLNVKNILNIQVTNKISSDDLLIKNDLTNNICIFPTNIDTINIGNYDILLVPDPIVSSLLLKNNFYEINKKIKECIIISLNVYSLSIFSSSSKPEIIIDQTNNQIAYNDNYARTLLHKSGFFEINSIYTYGSNIDNYFDTKITHFNLKNDFTIINSGRVVKKKVSQITKNGVVTKIYCGYKLPINIKIK